MSSVSERPGTVRCGVCRDQAVLIEHRGDTERLSPSCMDFINDDHFGHGCWNRKLTFSCYFLLCSL